MAWQRITIISRLFCLFMGIGGVFTTWLLLSNIDRIEGGVLAGVATAIGTLLFLVAGVLGRFPDAQLSNKEGDRG